MKQVIFGILAALFILNSMAHAHAQSETREAKTYTCAGIYARGYVNKHMKEEKYNRAMNTQRGDTSYNGFLTIMLLAGSAVTGSLPIILAASLTPAAISLIVNLPSKEERVLKLADESSKQFDRFLGRLQKKVSANITAQEVEALIQDGFASGEFCENMPNLHSPMDIRKHVKKALKAKYATKA